MGCTASQWLFEPLFAQLQGHRRHPMQGFSSQTLTVRLSPDQLSSLGTLLGPSPQDGQGQSTQASGTVRSRLLCVPRATVSVEVTFSVSPPTWSPRAIWVGVSCWLWQGQPAVPVPCWSGQSLLLPVPGNTASTDFPSSRLALELLHVISK